MNALLAIILGVLGITAAILLLIYVLVPLFKLLGWFIRHLFAFIGGMVYSLLRALGGIFTLIVLTPLIILNVVIGRWSAASHYGRSLQDELAVVGQCVYRFCIGHPARLLLLTPLLEGIEQRVPQAVANAPGSDKPSRRTGQFEGYTIVGSLKGGGSGGRLFIAEPDERKLAVFSRRGFDTDRVVIKSFSLADGSSLPQIVRESRALSAAKDMGLVLEHELTDKRFFYVMPYVPGDTLSQVTTRLHDRSGPDGLGDPEMVEGVGYVRDLLRTLDQYHRGGLWHKDVKPDNIIISDRKAHLVDFGLITPLRSAMTLTTHGTEYFRDPEMVRLALKGVKVHEVEGGKFDVYAAGAVLYSVVEHSFPAHGGLSRVTKRCPEAIRWIIRRAMTDYANRYPHAGDMLRDIEFTMRADDAYSVRPADLPSMKGGAAHVEEEPEHDEFAHVAAAAATPNARVEEPAPQQPAQEAPAQPAGPARRPRLRVTNWWTGAHEQVGEGERAQKDRGSVASYFRAGPVHVGVMRIGEDSGPGGKRKRAQHAARPAGDRRPATEQLASARARMESARRRAHERMKSRGVRPAEPNLGVGIAALVVLALIVVGVGQLFMIAREQMKQTSARVEVESPEFDVESFADFDWDSIPEIPESARLAMRDAGVGLRDAGRELREADGALRVNGESWGDVRVNGVPLREMINDRIAEARAAAESARDDVDRLSAKAPPSPPAAPAPLGRWLVIDDLAGSTEPDIVAARGRWIAGLTNAGCEAWGLGSTSEELEAVAEARKALGVGGPEDANAKRRLGDWVRASETFEGLVWMTRGHSRHDARAVVVADRDALSSKVAGALDESWQSR